MAMASLPPLLPTPADLSPLCKETSASTLLATPKPATRPGELFQCHILKLFHCSVTPSISSLGSAQILPTTLWISFCLSGQTRNYLSIQNLLNFWFCSVLESFCVTPLGFGLFSTSVANKCSSLFPCGIKSAQVCWSGFASHKGFSNHYHKTAHQCRFNQTRHW